MKMGTSLVAAGAMLVISATAVAAQDYAMAAPRGPDAKVTRADELKQEAEALFSNPKHWKKAQRLLIESAEMRDGADEKAYTCYMMAGRLAAVLGDNESARESLEKAAEHALARGALLDAASAFIDAAHAAARTGDREAVEELTERASLLASAPRLTDQERNAIRERLGA
ncbi:MAG: hypothetical protein GX539_15130 [Candidatus Cloacimonetes bacterium]|jgi:uncharacterized protein HemY|nr:hypothetical protein [Candidatus Cloacimonadota bacterium]